MATITTAASASGTVSRTRLGVPKWVAISALVLAVLPFVTQVAALNPVFEVVSGMLGYDITSDYAFLQFSLMMVFSVAVLGIVLLTGINGQISLGHGAFFAIGAYTAAILIDKSAAPVWAAVPAAAMACFVAGYGFGFPALRLEGHYLALATFALAVAVPQMLKYRHFEGLTGGVQGINLVKPEAPFGLPVSPDRWMYLVVLVTAIVMFWLARNLIHSRMGRAMMAIRDHGVAAEAMGIDVARVKTITFGISAMVTGVAGALHAVIFEFIAPDSFRLELSISLLVGAVVGGIATLPGAVIGGVFIQVVEKYADAVTRDIASAIHLPLQLEPWTIYGIMLIALMYLMPTGMAGGIEALFARLGRRAKPPG
ncbi:MAG: branched-chain amino acid ABC transporter permease [Hyphomicrobiaceae bacterium]